MKASGIPHFVIPGTAGSVRLHWRQTPRALADMARAAWKLRALVREVRPGLVHANSIRAGLICGLALRGLGVTGITHVRDCLPIGLTSRWSYRTIGRWSSLLIANSRFTRARIQMETTRAPVLVIHSEVNPRRFDPARLTRPAARDRLGLGEDVFAIGLVGQITPWKGQLDAVEALAALRRYRVQARLLLVGATVFIDDATRYDNRAYLDRLRSRITELDLVSDVQMLGEREDVPEILRALDVLVLPSWEEPLGRAALEGMAMALPVVATNRGGPRELIEDGKDGLLVPPRNPLALAAAVQSLWVDPERRRSMGAAARARVLDRFPLKTHVESVLGAYAGLPVSIRGQSTVPGGTDSMSSA